MVDLTGKPLQKLYFAKQKRNMKGRSGITIFEFSKILMKEYVSDSHVIDWARFLKRWLFKRSTGIFEEKSVNTFFYSIF